MPVLCVHAIIYTTIHHGFLLFLTLIYVIISLTLVLGNSCGKMEEVHMSGRASTTYWRAKCCETASLNNFYQLMHTVYAVLFRITRSPKKLFVNFDYSFCLFVCQILMVSKANAWHIKYLILKYPDEIK